MKLTAKQLEQALEMFAEGYSRPRVVSYFMETDDILRKQIEGNDNKAREVRLSISEQLRSVDPSSSRFAKSKYQEMFDLHFKAKMETLRNHYEITVTRSTTLMEHQAEKIMAQLQTLEAAVANVKLKSPTTYKDYISLLKLSDTLNKRLFDITDRLLERLDSVSQPNEKTQESHNPEKENE